MSAPENKQRCVFCEIVAGRAPAHKICEDELSLCLLDINPFAEGHCLVISKRHEPWWHDLSEDEVVSLFRLAKKAAGRIMKAFHPEFIGMYARGRRIPHTHIFLVPTVKDDVLDKYFNDLEKIQEHSNQLAGLRDPKSLQEAARRLKAVK
jgi:histidine triad (HIT) family protein